MQRQANKAFQKLNKKQKKQKKPKDKWIRPKYRIYIKSKAWFDRRKIFLEMFGDCCIICKTKEKIEVHHISYRNLGREKDEELVSLCKVHHKEYHEKYGVKFENFDTYNFIEEKQQEIEFAEIVKNL